MMHLFASYLDTQLLPLPNQPDVKPFSGYHYLKQGEKLPNLTNQSLLIQQCSDSPPYYRVVIGEEIYELVKVLQFDEIVWLKKNLPILFLRVTTICFIASYYSCIT